jgi:hypothetical protein
MSCGHPNKVLSNFCNKCGKPLNITAKASSPVITQTEEEEEKIIIPKKHRRGPVKVEPEEDYESQAEVIEDEEDNEKDGVSLNYVPDVDNIEMESMVVPEVIGISIGQIYKEAELSKQK